MGSARAIGSEVPLLIAMALRKWNARVVDLVGFPAPSYVAAHGLQHLCEDAASGDWRGRYCGAGAARGCGLRMRFCEKRVAAGRLR